MTDFQKAVAAVEVLETLVGELVSSLAPASGGGAREAFPGSGASGGAAAGGSAVGFVFDPAPRREPSLDDGDDWLLVGQMSAFESQVSAERVAQFHEAARLFEELGPISERMRRRCLARVELEVVRAQLHESLPGCPGNVEDAAEDYIKLGGPSAQAFAPLIARATELNRAATYGERMVEQVSDVLARIDATRALYDTDVVPRLVVAVAAAAADEAERRRAAELASEAAAEAAARQAQEEEKQPLLELLKASEEGLERVRREAEDRRRRMEAEQQAGCAAAAQRAMAPCARSFSGFS